MMGNLTPFVVNGPPVTNTNTVNFTGGPWTFIRTHVDSSAETLATWRLDEDTSSFIKFLNDTSSNTFLFPSMRVQSPSNNRAFTIYAGCGSDSSVSQPAMAIDGRTAADASLSTRNVLGIYNNGTNLAQFRAAGVLQVGNTMNTYARLGQKLETNTSADWGGQALNVWSTSSGHYPILDFFRSKSATIGTQTVVASGDYLGGIFFRGSDGTTARSAAGITAIVDGTPGSSDMPGRLMFYTTADGAASETERIRITNAGDVGVGKTPTTGIILDVGGQLGLKSYTVATLPSAAVQAGAIVYASDAGGNGPCLVISNGTNWKRCDNTSTTVS